MSALAARIVTAFLEPALVATDWREKWKGESLFNGDPARVQLTDGLRKRVAEILVLMGN